MKIFLLSSLLLLLPIIFSANAQGFIYDQQSANENTSWEGAANIQSLQPLGQSFTPTNSSIGFVQLWLFDGGPVGNGLGATLYVNLWSGSISNSTLLTSTTPVSLPDGFGHGNNNDSGIVTFLFPDETLLVPGALYYLQPVVQSGDTWIEGADLHFNYAGGTAVFNGTVDAYWDLWFREGVIAVPEPSSVALSILGISCLFFLQRRRTKQ